MSDVGISGASGTNGSSGADEAERRHHEDMEQARELLGQLGGHKPASDAETQTALRRFQLGEHTLRDSASGSLDAPTRALLEKRIREKNPLGEIVERIAHPFAGAERAAHDFALGHVHGLAVGDSFELTGTAKAAGGGVGTEDSGTLSVSRSNDGTYAIEASGDYAISGAGYVSGGGGAGVKLVATSQEDAVRLATILGSAGIAANLPLGLSAFVYSPTPDDVAFVREHVTSVSVSGEAAAKLKGSTGEREHGAGVFAAASISGTLTERVTMEMDHGAIKGVVCETLCKVKGSAQAGVDVKPSGFIKPSTPGTPVTPGSRDLGVNLDGSQTTTVSIKVHMDLPQHLTAEQQKMGPGALFTSVQAELLASARLDVAVQYEGAVGLGLSAEQGGAVGKASLTFEGVKADGTGSLVTALAHADLDAALTAAHVSAKTATAKLEIFHDRSTVYGGSVGDEKKAEVGLEVQAKERHRSYEMRPVTGTPSDVFRRLIGRAHQTQTEPAVERGYSMLC